MKDYKINSNLKMIAYASILLMFLTFSFHANAREIKGNIIPDSQKIGDQSLGLNGAGIRTKFIYDVYIGALYTVTASKQAEEIITASNPRRMNLIMLMDLETYRLADSLKRSLKANLTQEELDLLQGDTTKLLAIMETNKEVKKGDVITVDFLQNGVNILLNEKEIGSVESTAFPSNLLKVWLGAKPSSKSLKQDLLGG